MKNPILISLLFCVFCIAAFGQAKRKTTIRIFFGENAVAKTNVNNYSIVPTTISPSGVSFFDVLQKSSSRFSCEAIISFYLTKSWQLNTGLLLDGKGYLSSIVYHYVSGSTTANNANIIANYLGIPVEIERTIFKANTFTLSLDGGLAEQWKISSVLNGEYFLNNQLTFLGGLNFIVPYHQIAFIAHPIFRYSLTKLENPLISSVSQNFNSYSVGLELGISF